MEPTPDGHRAPIAELFKQSTCRSVDTQTPVNAYSTNSSSGKSYFLFYFLRGLNELN